MPCNYCDYNGEDEYTVDDCTCDVVDPCKQEYCPNCILCQYALDHAGSHEYGDA